MKLFAFTFVATILLVEISSSKPEENSTDKFQESLDKCAEELKVPQDKIKEYEAMDELPTDEMFMCLTACVLEKVGLLLDGKLREETVNAFVESVVEEEETEAMIELARRCFKEANAKTEKCEIAGVLSKCINDGMGDIKPAA